MRARWWGASAIVALAVLLAGWLLRPTAQDSPERASGDEPPASAPAAEPEASPAAPQLVPEVAKSRLGVDIRLNRRRSSRPRPPYGPVYGELEKAAQAGDVEAQYALGSLLYECSRIPADKAALEREIDQMQQTHRRGNWDVGDPAVEEKAMRSLFADCGGVPGDARGQYRDWLRRAADAGLVEAQLDLPLRLPPANWCQFLSDCSPEQRALHERMHAEAVDYLGRAREAGSASALWTFGAWYAEGEVLPQDNVEAYAHFLALDEINAATGDRRFDSMLASLRALLRPVDIERAEDRARELLENPRCCVVTP